MIQASTNLEASPTKPSDIIDVDNAFYLMESAIKKQRREDAVPVLRIYSSNSIIQGGS